MSEAERKALESVIREINKELERLKRLLETA
jgi:hypothetical protein